MRKNQKITTNIRFVQGPIHGISEYKMSNGMKILLMPDSVSDAITSLVVYRVGSRNEGPGNTGSAHFFEHLMFKVSRKFNADAGTNIDLLTKEIGANLNAYTSNDQTVYHVQAPAEHLELCLAIEADRMRGLRMHLDDRNSEMTVVRNEMEQGENYPEQVLRKQMFATAFREHPYHHDTIGSRTEVENVPLPNLKAFYHTYYWPNNATLIIVGSLDTEQTLKMIDKHFGKIPRSPHRIPEVYTVEPRQEGERRFQIRRVDNLYRLCLGFHVPEAAHPDQPALQALCEVLGNSYARSSRLYKRLVDGGIASQVYAASPPMRDPGLLEIEASLNPQSSTDAAEAAIIDEIERLKSELVPDQELVAIKAASAKNTTLSLAEPLHFGYWLAVAEAVADWTWLFKSDEQFNSVTPEDIRRVARQYLGKDNRTVGIFLPKTESESNEEHQQLPTAVMPEAVAVRPKTARRSPKAKDPNALARVIARFRGTTRKREPLSQKVITRTLSNGLTVVALRERAGQGAVVVKAAIRCGNYYESKEKQGLADMVGSMLTMGSQGLSKTELADELTELGIRNGLRSLTGPYLLETTAQVVKGDLPRFLSILSTVVRRPTFNQADLDTSKDDMRAYYLQSLQSPEAVANNALVHALYEPKDTFYLKTLEEQLADLEKMTVDDLKNYHRAFYTPGNTILTLVGDLEPEAAIAQVEEHFGDWTGAASPAVAVTQSKVHTMPEPIVQQLPNKPGVSIVLGQALALKQCDPDWDATVIALSILGGDTLTSRLGKKLREERGLTYGVHARQWDNSYGGAPWVIDINVNKDNIKAALTMTRTILEDFVTNGITDEELSSQVNYLTSSYLMGLTSLLSLASRISKNAALGLDLDSIDTYVERLRAVTRDDVNAAIKKHLNPSTLVTVIAGDT